MSLENLIAGSYGTADNQFAGNPNDAQRAREALIAAYEEQVGFEEFMQMHRDYLEGRGVPEDYILIELEKVKDITRYFDWD
jgi:hypothetical protein